MKTWLLPDLTNLTHRAWHALGRPQTAQPVAAAVSNWARSCAERVGATEITWAMDDPDGCTERFAMLPEYKAGRPDKDPALAKALAEVPDLLGQAGEHVVMQSGREADDLLAAAVGFLPEDWRLAMVTSDRDSFQLLSDKRAALIRAVNGGPEAWPLLHWRNIEAVTGGVTADAYPLYAALRGDSSDNIVGVKGVGEKSAAALVQMLPTYDALVSDIADGGRALLAAVGRARAQSVSDAVASGLLGLNIRVAAPLPCAAFGPLPGPMATAA